MSIRITHLFIFVVALVLTASMPFKAMSWSLNRYVVQPWWHFYEQLIASSAAKGGGATAIPVMYSE
jgi:hypothetical protein